MKQILAALTLVFVASAASAGVYKNKETLNDGRVKYSCEVDILGEIKDGHLEYWLNNIKSDDWNNIDHHRHNKQLSDWSHTKWCIIQALNNLQVMEFNWTTGNHSTSFNRYDSTTTTTTTTESY